MLAAVAAGCGAAGESPADDASPGHADAIAAADGGALDGPHPDAAWPPDGGPLSPDAGPDGGPGDPPPPPIERAQAGGETAAAAVAGQRAFIGVGPRLTVWDLSGGTPERIGETEPLGGVVTGVAISGDMAFVTVSRYGDGAFHAIDVADPTSPHQLAVLRLGTGVYSLPSAVDLSGSTAYVADAEQGVFRIDVTAPTHPIVTGFRPMSGATHVRVAGQRVHAAAVGFFGIAIETFDVSGDLAPLGWTHLAGALDAALTGDGLVLTRSPAGFAVDDLADPTSPVRIYSHPLTTWAMAPGEGGAWLTIDGHLRFLDLGDHAAITLGPAHDDPVWAVSAAAFADDRLVFTTHQGELDVFAVGESGPALLGRVPTGPCASCYATAAAGDMLVIAETTPGAVGTVGTASIGDLELDGQHMQLSAAFEDVDHAGGRAYVADWFLGLWAFDLTDPAGPVPTAYVPTGSYPSAIAASAGRVYLGESTNGGALRVFSPDGAEDPVQLGAIATGQVADLAIGDDLVYVAEGPGSGPGGMRIYDAQDPSAIALIGAANDCSDPRGVAVSGDLALVSCIDGVHVIDIGTPASPATLTVWTPPAPGLTPGVIAFDGSRGYYGHRGGVTVFDLTIPASPTTVAELPTAWIVRDLTVVAPGRVVASTSRGGLYQWELE